MSEIKVRAVIRLPALFFILHHINSKGKQVTS